MPVVESYPSIVGIAQVAQAAGQGRYNKWLAEYNARSNQMSTNALMSGFQTGSSLGMSIGNMWQQQQQFAQRQGFIESQAAQTLQKDTEYAAAMIPALDPLVQQMYPHLNEEQRGAFIGKMDRRQLDAMTNNLGNASRSRAAYDIFGSPQAIRKQAKATYDKMVTGQKHHNTRVQARLEPLFQRMRDNDLGLNEGSVQREIAQILREEGEAKEGQSFQETTDRNQADIYDNDGNLISKLVLVPDGKGGRKTMEIKIPQATTTGTRTRGTGTGGTMEDLKDYNTLQGYVDNRHKSMVDTWEQTYTKGYDFSESDVATHVEPNGSLWRRRRPDEVDAKHILRGRFQQGGVDLVPATIPPRPTRKQAEDWVSSRYPGFSKLIGSGGPPGGEPIHNLVFPHEWPAVQGARGAAADQQPGQAMPQVPRPQGLPTTAYPLPPQRVVPSRDPNMIQRSEEARAIAVKKIRADADVFEPGKDMKHSEIGVATHHGLTELIGSEGRQPTALTAKFQSHVRAGGDPKDFADPQTTEIMVEDERKSLNKHIIGFDDKVRPWMELGMDRAVEQSYKEGDSYIKNPLRDYITETERNEYRGVRMEYLRKRKFATEVAAAAVKATPIGEPVDIANIPIMDQRTFELRVMGEGTSIAGQGPTMFPPIRPGDVFLTPKNGLFIVTSAAINAARRSYLLREHSRTQPPVPGFPTQPAR